MSQLWEVVGGADTGGIVVREGKDLESAALSRLAFGAIVHEVELEGKRLKYKKVRGEGPEEGWVSLSSKKKDFLVKIAKEPEEQADLPSPPEKPQKTKTAKEDSAEDWYMVPSQAPPKEPAGTGEGEGSRSPQEDASKDALPKDEPGVEETAAQETGRADGSTAEGHSEEASPGLAAKEDKTAQAEEQAATAAADDKSSLEQLQLPPQGVSDAASLPKALTPLFNRPWSPMLFLNVPSSSAVKRVLEVQSEARPEPEVQSEALPDSVGTEKASWLGKAFGRLWRSDAEQDAPLEDEVDDEVDSEDSEDSDAEFRRLPREKRKCCSPGCPYRVHTLEAYGSFCCIACFETSGYDHGARCEKIRFEVEEEQKKEEEKKDQTQEDEEEEEDSEDDKEKIEAEAKKKAEEEAQKKKDAEKPKESQEELDAKDMIEKATRLAGKLKDIASNFLSGSSSTSDEDSKELQVLKDIARKHGATGKLDLAKKLQESASALLMDGTVEEVEKLAKKMQDAAFGLLKQAEPENNDEEEKKEGGEPKHAKSEVKEDKAKTPEYWRKEVSKQRRTGSKDDVLRVLHEAVPELLKEKLVEEMKQLALRMQKLAATLVDQPFPGSASIDPQQAESSSAKAEGGESSTERTEGAKSPLVTELEETAAELVKAGVVKEGADLAKKMQDLVTALQPKDDDPKDASALAEAHFRSNVKDVTRRMRESATALLKGAVIEEARMWAKETEHEYRKIGSRWRLGVALNNIATAHLRMLEGPYMLSDDVLDSRAKSTLQSSSDRCREALVLADEAVSLLRHIGHPREELDLAAARSVLSKLRDLASQDEVLKAKEDLAEKGKISKADQTKGEGTLKSWRKTVSKQRAVYEQAPTGRGDHLALANTLQQAASFFLKKGGAAQEAAAMAEEAASLYKKTGDPLTVARALDLCAKAHLKIIFEDNEMNMSALIERQNLLKAKTSASEAVSTLGKRKVNGLEYALASCHCTLARVHALELNENEEHGLLQSMYQTLVSKFRGSGRINLHRSFGYVAGLQRPPKFARFDIRNDICLRVGGFTHGQIVKDPSGNKYIVIGVKFSEEDEKLPQLYFQPKSLGKPATCCFTSTPVHALKAVLTPTGKEDSVEEVKPQDFDVGEDSDGEMVTLCHECLLPLGGARYASSDGDGFMHGECMARILLDKSQSADTNREHEDARRKARDREEYNIGWRADRMIPRNDDFLRRAKVKRPPGAKVDSMYGLVLESGSPAKVRLVPTTDPEAFINLNYLMLALQVRIKANMAPYFSLDSPHAYENWQCKVFGPQWLKGTAVGEILFQADYHLKELSMGDSLFDQPIVGMKSCWDYSWGEEGWRGREWFVVRNAKVNVSDNNVLLPHVQMGVEAREQVTNNNNQLVDAPVTSTSHPLVKYAEEFSHFFDLVAERKSVIFQMREVSRAVILAKFLVDNKVAIDDLWLAAKEDNNICKIDLPHNKQERYSYNIMVCDGVIREQHGGVLSGMVGLYGGVDLNIEAFDLTMPTRISKSIEAPNYAAIYAEAGQMGTADELTKLSQRELRKLVQEAGGEPPIGPTEKSDLIDMLLSLRRAAEDEDEEQEDGEQPKEKEGLEYLSNLEEDLRKLSLAPDTVRSVLAAIRERAGAPKVEKKVSKENQFWESLNDENNQNAGLFKSIFRSRLADREKEHTFFIPPMPKESYLKKLQGLVDEEKAVQEKRRTRFLSKDFVPSAPGEFFPTSWKPNFQMHLGRGESVGAGGNAARGKRLVESAADGKLIIENVKPMFDKRTEDFTRFRIYRRGNVEVRTIQEDGSSDEVIGVVFEVTTAPPLSDNSPVVKVTEFVKSGETSLDAGKEQLNQGEDAHASPAGDSTPAGRPGQLYVYFVLYETDLGDAIVTEQLPDGAILWEENPADMDERFMKARVLRVSDCSSTRNLISDLRHQYQEAVAEAAASADSLTRVSTRRYASMAFEWPGGKPIVSDDSKPQKAPEIKPLPKKDDAQGSWLPWGKANSEASPAAVPPPPQPAAGAPRNWLPQMFQGRGGGTGWPVPQQAPKPGSALQPQVKSRQPGLVRPPQGLGAGRGRQVQR